MTKIQVNSQGKAYISSSGKALLSTGGGSATLITKTITQNGTYNASSDNADGYSSVTVNVSGSSGKYQLLERVKDDNNTEIGTVSGFFTDANDVEYAVVCLDASYRLSSGRYCSNYSNVTDLPIYTDQTVWSSTETANFNTQKILDFCVANNYTSTACTHCRNRSFTISGITYYGQLPNIVELVDIFRRRISINSADTSASSYSSLVIPTSKVTWSSTQTDNNDGLVIIGNGRVGGIVKTSYQFVIPVLELPN